jgi:hypothetical protein
MQKKLPKSISFLAAATAVVFIAQWLGLLGNRPYIVFATSWLLLVAIQLRVRTVFPQTPEFAFVAGWFFLAAMAVFIGFMFIKSL